MIERLENRFDDLVFHAQEDMETNHVNARRLRQSIVRLPYELKKEHKIFIKELEEDLKKAESIDDIFFTANKYWDFLNYSLLQHVINRHASDEVKKEMERYAQEILAFRKKTCFSTFSKAYKRKPKEIDQKFRKLVTEHDIDWSTATLEDLEHFRSNFCTEISLIDFSLQLEAVEKGSVVITWLVPQSLVAHIQKAITLSSQTMQEHHVTRLTVDGFIIYDGNAGGCMCHPTVTLFSMQGSLRAIMQLYLSCSNCTISLIGACTHQSGSKPTPCCTGCIVHQNLGSGFQET